MTKKEVCERFGFSENNFTKNFKRCQKIVFDKYHVNLIKEGRGESATYIIEENSVPTVLTTSSIDLIKDAHKEVVMDRTSFGELIDWDFMVFIGIITCPFMSFRGTYKQFLDYVGIKDKSKVNINRLKATFEKLAKNDYIYYILDDSLIDDEQYFGLFIKRKTEVEMKIGIDMIQRCMRLQKANNMNSWVPLLKTWLGLQLISMGIKDENQNVIFNMSELEEVTGVNKKMLTKCKKILEQDNLFQTSFAYVQDKRIGQKLDLNGIEYRYVDLQ